jgi:hypothetical protein
MLLHCARTLGHGGCDGDLENFNEPTNFAFRTNCSYSHPRCLDTLLFLSASYGLTVVLAFTDDLSTWSLTVSRR